MGLIKDAVSYSGATAVAHVMILVQGLVLRRLLPPEIMGLWSFVSVVLGVAAQFTLGILIGAGRELPILRGRGDKVHEDAARATSFWYFTGERLIVGVAVVCYGMLAGHEFYPYMVAGFLLGVSGPVEAYVVSFQSAQAYVRLSQLVMWQTAGDAALLTLGASLGGVRGVMVGAMISATLRIAVARSLASRSGISIEWRWDSAAWRRMASYGIRFRATDIPRSLAMMLDVLWVTRFMGIEALALYSLANSLAAQVGEIPTRICNVFATRLLAQHGAGRDQATWGEGLRRFLLVQMLVSCPLVCVIGGLAASLVTHYFIPAYEAAIPPLLVLSLMSFFRSHVTGLVNPWFIENRLFPFGISNLVALLANGSTLTIAYYVAGTRSLVAVAWAMVIGTAVYFGYMLFTVGRPLWGIRAVLGIFAEGTVAVVWTAAVLQSMEWALAPAAVTGQFFGVLAQWILVIVLITPLVIYGSVRTSALEPLPLS